MHADAVLKALARHLRAHMRTLVLRKRDGVDLYLGYVSHDVQRQRAPSAPNLEHAVPQEDGRARNYVREFALLCGDERI
jgi:hypothetical protein